MENKNVLRLRTQDQVTIFKDELSGQISDGHWENSKPHDHWMVWCGAEVIVDSNLQGRNFDAKRVNYNLLSKELLSVVGERIIVLVKMGRAFGAENARILSDFLFTFQGSDTRYENYVYTGPKAYIYEKKGHFNNVRSTIERYTPEQIKAAAEADTYTRKDMLADLREIRTAMQTKLETSPEVQSNITIEPWRQTVSNGKAVKPAGE
jgi:hypothetical protein